MDLGEPWLWLDVAVEQPIDLGQSIGSGRRMVPISGGRASGALDGVILPGGADWQTIAPDGTIEIAATYIVETTEGRVEISSNGLRHGPPEVLARLARGEAVDPAEYYFRTTLRFRTGSAALDSFNRVIGIATGRRESNIVHLTAFALP